MKAFKIILLVLIIGFITVQIFAMRSQSNIEIYPYAVVKKYDAFEIRKYEASLFRVYSETQTY